MEIRAHKDIVLPATEGKRVLAWQNLLVVCCAEALLYSLTSSLPTPKASATRSVLSTKVSND